MVRGGRARKSELIVAATAATGSLLYCWCSARWEDAANPRPQSTTVPSDRRRKCGPERVPDAPVLGGGIFERLDDDMVLMVLQHVCLVAAESANPNVATDAAAAALIAAGGINRQWRRLSGLRCFWMPLCRHHFGVSAEPVECPRWRDGPGVVPLLQVHETQSSNSYYEALGVDEGASAQEIAAAYTKAIRDVAAMSTGAGEIAVVRADDATWRNCWFSWHAEAATQIGHTHMPLQRLPGGTEPLPGNRPICGPVWCRVVDCWRRIHEFCTFVPIFLHCLWPRVRSHTCPLAG